MSAGEPERADRELEALLRRIEAERPSESAREEARRAFLGAARPGESQAAASLRRENVMPPAAERALPDDRDGGEDAFAAWIGARSAGRASRPEARRRARLAFLSALAAAPSVAPRSRRYRSLVILAAAAAIVLVTLLVPEPDRWRVRLDGGLALDEADFALGDEDRLAAELERSGWVETRGGRARFSLGRVLELELLPGSSLHFPGLPELDGLSSLDFELARGEVYLRTLGSYPGNPIRVRADGLDVALDGTSVGVLVDELGTCVCVAEGSVRLTSPQLAAGSEDVPAPRTVRVFRSASMGPKSEPFPSDTTSPGARHVQDLLEFHRSR